MIVLIFLGLISCKGQVQLVQTNFDFALSPKPDVCFVQVKKERRYSLVLYNTV